MYTLLHVRYCVNHYILADICILTLAIQTWHRVLFQETYKLTKFIFNLTSGHNRRQFSNNDWFKNHSNLLQRLTAWNDAFITCWSMIFVIPWVLRTVGINAGTNPGVMIRHNISGLFATNWCVRFMPEAVGQKAAIDKSILPSDFNLPLTASGLRNITGGRKSNLLRINSIGLGIYQFEKPRRSDRI